MQAWDGSFDVPGDPPMHVPSSHVPMRTVTTKRYEIDVVHPVAAAIAPMPIPSPPRRDQAPRFPKRRDRTTMVMILAIVLGVTTTLLSHAIPWVTGTALSLDASRIMSSVANLFGIVAMFAFVSSTFEAGLRSEAKQNAEESRDVRALSDVCHDIRGAHRQYRPSGGGLHTALVEATHRCCRIVNIAGDSTDLQVVETVALVKCRLPALLAAYERTQAVGDPKELWTAVDRMAEAVVMIGDQAEEPRRRLMALATDDLETEVRYLSARTGQDGRGFSSILAPVN
jgi:hypothetical protein